MNDPQRLTRWLLRIIGSAALLALPCALMPQAWMDAIHRYLGMGPIPQEPIVGYLARSTSAFYAMLGGLLWVVSFDLVRYVPVIKYVGLAATVLGVLLLGVDYLEGMPTWWIMGEGPFNIVAGLVLWFLARRIADGPGKSTGM